MKHFLKNLLASLDLLASLGKPVIKSLMGLTSVKHLKSLRSLEIQTPIEPPVEQQAEVGEEGKVDLRATKQIDPRYTRPIGKL